MSAKCACKMKMFMSNLESLCCHLICIIQTNCLTTFDEVVNHNIVVLWSSSSYGILTCTWTEVAGVFGACCLWTSIFKLMNIPSKKKLRESHINIL
jgi:hypothetical protein